jgi:hypothetical protein
MEKIMRENIKTLHQHYCNDVARVLLASSVADAVVYRVVADIVVVAGDVLLPLGWVIKTNCK